MIAKNNLAEELAPSAETLPEAALASPTPPPSVTVAELTREFWQTTGLFDPKEHLRPVLTRYEIGQALRERTPREAHAGWQAAEDRPDPIDILRTSNHGRQEDLVPLRMGRMAASPFAFFRGAAAVMA